MQGSSSQIDINTNRNTIAEAVLDSFSYSSVQIQKYTYIQMQMHFVDHIHMQIHQPAKQLNVVDVLYLNVERLRDEIVHIM